jgi:hypothetical protein
VKSNNALLEIMFNSFYLEFFSVTYFPSSSQLYCRILEPDEIFNRDYSFTQTFSLSIYYVPGAVQGDRIQSHCGDGEKRDERQELA